MRAIWAIGSAAAAAALLAGCAVKPPAPAPQVFSAPTLRLAAFAELPGWRDDALAEALPALRLQCQRLALLPADTKLGGQGLAALYGGRAGQWHDACAALAALRPQDDPRGFFEAWFQPYEATASALVTGYFEPLVAGAETRGGAFQTPVLSRPTDLTEGRARDAQGRAELGRMAGGKLVPYYSRAEIESGATAATTHAVAWVRDPADLFVAQIQGAMLLQLPEGGTLRLVFDGRNGRPYTPIGRILKDENAIAAQDISLQTIRAWLDAHPQQAKSLMDRNEAYVFFRPAPESDPQMGPPGALGVALTAGRSAAVDKTFLPLASPLFVTTTIPDGRAWRHLVLAQDLGSAIDGPSRVDLFLGVGAPAAAWAGRMHQQGEVWLLLPRAIGTSS